MSTSYNVKEVFSGVLHKCGGKVKSWNRRWFILKSDYCLYYYKDTAKGHLGVISLRDPKFKVRKGSTGDTAWPKRVIMESTIAVVTSHRTYYMYSTSKDDADEWTKVLEATRTKLLDEASSANRLLSGTRSYSAATSSDQEKPTRSKLLSDSTPSTLMENEQTYEAVYDSPEADLSQHSSSGNSPNLDSHHTSGRSPTSAVGGGTDSFYDLANAEDHLHHDLDSHQPLYAEALAPDNENGEEGEPDAVYDDVEIQHPNSANKEMNNGKDICVEMYEPLDLESPHTPPSAKSLPLPPVPLGSGGRGGETQPIYEDIPDPSGSAQPLYEAVMPTDSPTCERYIKEVDASDDEDTHSSQPVPPLPPKDDLPPLPPKDDLPPLPAKDDLPPLPAKDNMPDLPPKDSPPSRHRGQSAPTPPPKVDIQLPPLPPKEDSLEQESNKRGVPPLALKKEASELDHKPLVSPRHTSSSRHGSSSSNGSLSPSAQRKPTPRERTLTPPPNRKPSPVPRRKVCPVTTDNTTSRQVVNGHAPHREAESPPPGATKVKVHVTSPTHREPPEALLQTCPEERGMLLFKQRGEFVDQQTEVDLKNRAESIRTLSSVTSDPKLSPHHKAVFSETLREIEHERLKASEERFRWERERMKLEEERRRFEEEKRQLQEEIQEAKRQLQERK